jgi:hypothetical protein
MDETFLAEWLRARAVVILTRRDDLTIRETKANTGLDLHVYIDREDKPMRLMFGILLHAVPSPIRGSVNRLLAPTMQQFRGMKKFTYPVCLFFFTMREEQTFFAWLAEPVVIKGAPKLIHHGKAHGIQFTNELLNQVIEQIVAWYDAVEAVLIA